MLISFAIEKMSSSKKRSRQKLEEEDEIQPESRVRIFSIFQIFFFVDLNEEKKKDYSHLQKFFFTINLI